MINENYEKEVDAQLEKVAKIRIEWAKKSEENKKLAETHGQLYEYGYDPIKTIQCNPCEVCGATKEEFTTIAAACRMNGDAHGSIIIWCSNCGLCLHKKWDDH
jgi:hypothetical protein